VDPIVLVIVVVIVTPLAVIWALAKSSQLRGPLPRKESRRPVDSLVTDALPEEHPDDEADEDAGPEFSIDSPPPEADPGLRERSED
jgi:hypothetical protein